MKVNKRNDSGGVSFLVSKVFCVGVEGGTEVEVWRYEKGSNGYTN